MDSIDIQKLITAHRLSVWAVIAGFVGAITHLYVALAVIPFHLFCAWRVGRMIHVNNFLLAVVLLLMLLPVANTLTLLLLNNRAAKVLKLAGIPIGPFGFRREGTANYSMEMLKAIQAKGERDDTPPG